MTVATVQATLETSQPTALSLTNQFVDLGILRETTGRRRNRIFLFAEYLTLFPEAEESA